MVLPLIEGGGGKGQFMDLCSQSDCELHKEETKSYSSLNS